MIWNEIRTNNEDISEYQYNNLTARINLTRIHETFNILAYVINNNDNLLYIQMNKIQNYYEAEQSRDQLKMLIENLLK